MILQQLLARSGSASLLLFLLLPLCVAETTALDLTAPSRGRNQVTLSGIVAAGRPLAAEVTAMNVLGEISASVTTHSTDGSFNLEIPRARPYLLRAQAADGKLYYSFCERGGEVNITPLTHLALFMSDQWKKPEDLWQRWSGPRRPKTRDIRRAAQRISDILAPKLRQAGVDTHRFDLFTTPFKANGQGVDRVLDQIHVEIDSTKGRMELRERAGNKLLRLREGAPTPRPSDKSSRQESNPANSSRPLSQQGISDAPLAPAELADPVPSGSTLTSPKTQTTPQSAPAPQPAEETTPRPLPLIPPPPAPLPTVY